MDLLCALHATWPAAATSRLGPWVLRDDKGGGRRVSAATLEAAEGDPEPAIAAMRRRGQRPLILVREGQGALDAALAARGLVVEAPTLFYAAPSSAVAYAAADLIVIDCDGPLAALEEIWRDGGIGAARVAVMERAPSRRFLLGRIEDRPAAAGFVAAAGGVAMLHALHVLPRARRRGLGRRLSQWAAAWGAGQGAAVFAVAVEAENAAARALYESLGMARAGGYHYRVAPA